MHREPLIKIIGVLLLAKVVDQKEKPDYHSDSQKKSQL